MNICYIVNNADFFISHRLDLGIAARKKFEKANLICPKIKDATLRKIIDQKLSVTFSPNFHTEPSFRNIAGTVKMAISLALSRESKHSLFHIITIKAILLFGLPLRALNRNAVFALSGMGTVFTSNKTRYRFARIVIRLLYTFLFNGKRSTVIVQNEDDLNLLLSMGVHREKIVKIMGSGVNPAKFPFKPKTISKDTALRILVPARLIKEKGIYEACAASDFLNNNKIHHQMLIAGTQDRGNPLSLSSKEIQRLQLKHPSVNFIGHIHPIHDELYKSSIVCLPSYREGLPKALIEAFAAGRPVVTYDTVGCREIVSHEVTGLLAPLKSKKELAEAIQHLYKNPYLTKKLTQKAHDLFMREMSTNTIIQKHFEIYEKIALTHN